MSRHCTSIMLQTDITSRQYYKNRWLRYTSPFLNMIYKNYKRRREEYRKHNDFYKRDTHWVPGSAAFIRGNRMTRVSQYRGPFLDRFFFFFFFLKRKKRGIFLKHNDFISWYSLLEIVSETPDYVNEICWRVSVVWLKLPRYNRCDYWDFACDISQENYTAREPRGRGEGCGVCVCVWGGGGACAQFTSAN